MTVGRDSTGSQRSLVDSAGGADVLCCLRRAGKRHACDRTPGSIVGFGGGISTKATPSLLSFYYYYYYLAFSGLD